MEPQLQSQEEAKEIPGEDRRGHANPPNSKWDQLSLPGSEALPLGFLLRQDKRKAMKKLKRKQMRKEAAEKERMQEEARLRDPAEQLRIQQEEEAEAKAQETARREFEERERIWFENHQRTIAEAQRKHQEDIEKNLAEEAARKEEEENWEYVEGPAEIIWQGNEIIVQKKKVKVPKWKTDVKERAEDSIRPTSNPLPPQHATFEAYKKEESSTTSLRLCDGVEQQISNIGTEQDKAHCPFHFKTGACRFGSRCSRAHFYPDKSCILLMKNMYNGPGLTWEQEEGLEYTEEEVTQHYEEFYDDVHTEFLKFGELVNFKVCKNGSSHLRGNVYVHYHSLDSAVSAYNAINGRFFAGKQVTCEFVGVSRWKVALCGEYMRSCYKNCSHGSECNFLHCFQNPGREYDWADWDNPPPRSWVIKMEMLFGISMSRHNSHRKLKEQDNLHRYGQSERRIQSGGSYRSNSRQHKSHELISWTSDYSGGTSLRQHTGGLHYDKKTQSEVSCRSSFRKYKSYESDSCSNDEIGETPLKEHSSGNKYIVDEGELGSDTDQSCDTYGRKSNRKSRSSSRVGSGKRKRDGKGISEEDRSMDRAKRSKYQSRHILRDDNEKRERIVDDYMYFVVEKQPKRRESRNKFVNELDESRSYDRDTMEEDFAKSSCYEKERRKASRTAEDHLESSNIDNEKIKTSRRGHRLAESRCNHKDNREESGKQQYSKSPRRSMNNNRSKREDIGQSMSPKQHKYSSKFSSRNRDVSKAPKRSSDEDSLDTLDRWQASDDVDF